MTRKWEEGDALSPRGMSCARGVEKESDEEGGAPAEEQAGFYEKFYSAFEDQLEAMAALLRQKETFAARALAGVLKWTL
eukprot:jgi/Mesen1/1247/ME000129S00351